MKAKQLFYILALICVLPLQSCYIYNDEEFADDPEGNFEMLWKICDEYYCYFDYKNVDWDSIHVAYKERINNGMSNDELFKVCADMLSELRDGHVNLYYSYDGSRNWSWFEDYPENYSERIILENYFNFDYHRMSGFIYQTLPQNIGYMHYDSFSSEFSDGLLNHMLTQFKDCKGVIIDIRSNGGGSIANVNKLACRFTNQDKILCGYELIKTGPGHNEFGDTVENYLKTPSNMFSDLNSNANMVKYLKDVVILTNRGVYSAANDFVRTMKVLDNVTIIGDRTGGGAGAPINFELPNGWIVRLSTTPMLDVNMEHTEFGIDPTEGFKVDMAEDAHITGKDAILDKAIELLSTK